ncbi:MAG: glycosyltransferase 87 family protein [Patulibacter sp.]
MILSRQRLGAQLAKTGRTVTGDAVIEPLLIALATALAAVALREYIAPDYRAEYLPALNGYRTGGLAGFAAALPGYPGAVVLQLPLIVAADLVGLSEAGTWRLLSGVAVAVLALAVLAFMPLLRAAETPRGAARVAIALAVASPGAYWALRIGHPEEVLTVGLLLAAAAAAAGERAVLAGLLLGFAAGKAWPIVAALPVVGLLLPQWRHVAVGGVVAAVTTTILHLPALLHESESVHMLSHLGVNTIFNAGQVWWWFGTPIPLDTVATQTVPQPRIGPAWSGELSHPLILGVGTAVGLLWCWARWSSLREHRSIAVLRADHRARSHAESARLAGAALLTMAGILYARCYLDTWNVPYYLTAGLVLGALGESLLGRWPIISLLATGLMWKYHAPGDLTIRTAPDLYNAMFVAWTVPFSVALVVLGFRAVRDDGRPISDAAPGELR